MMAAAQVLACLLVPAFALWAAERNKLVKTLGPVTLCYVVGIVAANLPGLRLEASASMTVAQVTVPLAIPLLLFSTDLKAWVKLAPSLILGFTLACVSAVVAASAVGWAFRGSNDEWWKIAGMLVAVYTGGTPNMSAVGQSLGVKSETFVLLNAADLLCTGTWLFFVLSFAQRVLGKILRPFTAAEHHAPIEHPGQSLSVWTRGHLRPMGLGLLLALAIVGGVSGVAFAVTGDLPMAPVLLSITTLAILASLVPSVRQLTGPFELGEYILLVFCVAMGSLADARLVAGSGLSLVGLVALVVVLALALHLALSKLFKQDVDTMLVCSSAALFGPAQIGPVAAALNNRVLVGPGLTLGLAGLALGTYLGLGVSYALRALAGGG